MLLSQSIVSAQPGLKDAFKGCFLVGAALNESQFSGRNSKLTTLITNQFNSITPENVMKWDSIHPKPGKYDFRQADRYVEFGEKHGMFIVGHNLVWHSQTPAWVFQDKSGKPLTRDALLERMSNHIFTVVGRYRGRIGGWDVVNEALNDDGTLRESPWMKIIGEDYLLKAFEFARQADPQAELYYNDFSLENEAKGKGAVNLIRKLLAGGAKISAVGMQGHYKLDWPSAGHVDDTITAFSNLGIKVAITELDLDVLPSPTKRRSADVSMNFAASAELNPYTNGLPDDVQQKVTRRYVELFQVFLKHRDAINRVTFWGVRDGDSWLNNWPIHGRKAYPLLFDSDGKPNSACQAVMELREALSSNRIPTPNN
jgi:endo-1,4-beta-xylanase